MNKNIFYSSDLINKDRTNIGLFDRIINIKFTRQNGETFTLHSDYEPVWTKTGLRFVTCQPKPEIRVQYTQYQKTLINVDIYITNLNIIEDVKATTDASAIRASIAAVTETAKQGKTTNQPNDALTMLGNKVIKAEIEMGYRGQFHNWSRYNGKTVEEHTAAYKAFQNLEQPTNSIASQQIADAAAIAHTQLMFTEIRKCSVVVEWAANISNPPDRITQFHGYVGATEAGFQPFALVSLDCAAESGAKGMITKRDIWAGLDDEYYAIDQVLQKDLGKGKNNADLAVVFRDKQTNAPYSYRNFFNGGNGFTLLEAFCFHMVTRRFARSNVNIKRNVNLEQAALEYSLASKLDASNNISISQIKEEIEQKIYAREKIYRPDYFTEETNKKKGADEKVTKIVPNFNEMSADFKNFMEQSINSLLVEQYIGARYTIKNLPEYRRLYLAIRRTLMNSYAKGESMSWWEAADQYKNIAPPDTGEFNRTTQKNAKGNLTDRTEKQWKDEIASLREYTLSLENGELGFVDSYIPGTFGDDWIIPVQNIAGSVPLRNAQQTILSFYPPTGISATGFTGKGAKIPMKCFSGLFEVRDAYMLGIPVLCSEGASRVFANKNSAKEFIEMQFIAQAQGQIEWICSTWGLQYYKLNNGGFFLYVESESARDTAGQLFVTNQSSAPFRIPAIYDMTLSPIRKIRAPFMAFLDPMTLVEWNSTATIGTMISFYYQPQKGRNFFLIISSAIDFATTGEYNTMELSVVDAQYVDRKEVPPKIAYQELIDAQKILYTEVVIFPDANMDSWVKIYESFITRMPVGLRELWKGLLTSDDRIPGDKFFSAMADANPTLFAMATEGANGWEWEDSKKRVDKQANELYGKDRPAKQNFPSISYCMSIIDVSLRRVYIRFPFLPDNELYTNSSKTKNNDASSIMVYKDEKWLMMAKTDINSIITIGDV